MKQEQLYQELQEIARKLGVEVKEKSFRNLGITVRSGFCRIKTENRFLMDKHKPLPQKVAILATELNHYDLDSVYIVPAVREALEQYAQIELPDIDGDD